jgi:NADPH-dependent curcumin reductase CurA
MTLNRRDFTLTSLSALGALAMNPALAAEPAVNRCIVLASRPRGKPTLDNFRLENAPQAFLGLFSGANFGKLVVRVN